MNNLPLISDIMVTDVVAVDMSDDLRTVSRVFDYYTYDYVPVLGNGRLKGVIQRSDYEKLSRRLSRKAPRQSAAVLATVQAKALMTNNMIKLATYDKVNDAIEIFQTGLFPTIPVVNDYNELVGIVTYSDLLNHDTDSASPAGSGR